MSLDVTERAKVERILLFRPCEDQKSLGEWIKHFLQIDFPDCIVDEDSNSSPLAIIWEIYNQALYVNDPDFDRILSYANRGGAKTLGAAVLELLMVFHDERDVVHLASVEEQSSNCLEYVKKFLRQPFFSPFVTQNDSRGIAITRFRKDNEYLTPKEYASVPDLYKSAYREVINKIEIVVATPESVNGKHGTFCVVGSTPIIIVDDPSRSRVTRSAKSIFNTIAGISASGRKSLTPLSDMDVARPKKKVSLLTFNFEKGTFEPKRIVRGSRRTSKTVKVVTEKGRELTCTHNHPIYVPGKGFIDASELIAGIQLFAFVKKGFSVDKVLSVSEEGEEVVYDFEVEDNHNFFASRLLTHNCVYDELDLLDNETVWNEAQGIAKERDGKMPITYMTSTRKKMSGRVQDQIDKSHENGLKVRHWNLVDGSRKCEPDRHRPDLPKLKMYIDDVALKAIPEEEYLLLKEVDKPKYTELKAFSGCKGCKLLPACKTRLATHQKSNSSMLISLPSAQNSLTRGSLEFIKSQVLCRKPLSTGSIFNRFSRDRHVLTPAQIYERIEQSPAPKGFSKQHLIKYLKQMEGVKFWGGMDFGYTHLFVATILAQVGRDFYVLDCVAQAELETMECVELCQKEIGHYGASYYPDPENPALIKTFQKARFRMVDWAKKKGTVLGGIEAVRAKLHPGVNAEPELYFLGGDAGVEMLIQATEKWSWKLNPAGQPTETPKEEFKDYCFTEDTEVLTENGWMSLAKVTVEEKVLAVTETGVAHFEYPSRVVHRDYSGPMTSVYHTHLKFSSTADHVHAVMTQYDWKVKKRWILRKEKTVGQLPAESYWANGIKSLPSGPGLFEEGVDEAWLAGFWVAEGCFDDSNPTQILIDQKKEQHKTEVRRRLANLGWSYFEKNLDKSCKGMVRFCINKSRKRITEWKRLFNEGAKNKQLLPSDVAKMTSKERREFYEGYMAGDGCRTQSNWHFDSVSEKLIDGIQFLCLSLGYGCRKVTYKCMEEGRLIKNPSTGKTYSVSLSWRGHIIRKKPVSHIKKSEFFEWDATNIQVHCVTTSTGMFLARTAGDVFVAGNCDPIRYVIMNVAPLKGYRGARGAYGPRAPDPNSPKSVSKRFWEALRADGVVPSTIEEEPGQDPDAPRPRRKFYF